MVVPFQEHSSRHRKFLESKVMGIGWQQLVVLFALGVCLFVIPACIVIFVVLYVLKRNGKNQS